MATGSSAHRTTAEGGTSAGGAALTPAALRALAVRLGLAWREIRRGASNGPLRDFLYTVDARLGQQIELGQVDTLDLLAQRPSWRMSELAEALRVEPSTATRAVQRLERAGLAQRRPSTDDGRVVMVEITAAGTDTHDAVAARRTELFTHILHGFSAEELPVFVSLLERFVASVDEFVTSHQPIPPSRASGRD